MADSSNNNSFYNFRIVSGEALPSAGGTRTSHQFSYIDFTKVEVLYVDKSWEDEDKAEKLWKIVENNPAIIVIETIGNLGGLGHGNEGLLTDIMDANEAAKYSNVPCAVQTPIGSIIPQIIVPGKSWLGYQNGMLYGTYSEAGFPTETNADGSYKDDNGSEWANKSQACVYAGKNGKTGYNWKAAIFPSDAVTISDAVRARMNDISTYGKACVDGYVTNESSAKKYIDVPVFATRKYRCDLSQSEAGAGSLAFCYKILDYNNVNEGSTATEKANRPNIHVLLAGDNILEKGMDDDDNEDGDGNNEQYPPVEPDDPDEESDDNAEKNIAVIIPPDGEMGFYIGGTGKVETGSFPKIESDIIPPCCKKTESGDYTLLPLYVVPTYAGMIFTDSVLMGMNGNGANYVFVKYPEVNDPVSVAQINNDGGAKTDDIKDSIKKDGQELMNYFPAVIQERQEGSDTRIKVPYKNSIRMGNFVDVKFTKSVGRWAYCPIFFQRHVKFTYYFKGEYVSDEETAGKYSFYPVLCSNVGESATWDGINSKGAASIGSVRLVKKNKEKQEALYAVDIEFKASSYQRYPIEIFGMTCVYKYKQFQFGIKNGNGRFSFDKDFQDSFSYIYNNRVDKDRFLDFVTSCNISSSLDGVSGSMSLDGYALSDDIDTWLQDQSMGEVDLDIEWMTGLSNSSVLFKGYAGEIQSQGSEGGYGISVNLFGTNRKMDDMKLICAPFWDGDKLTTICRYFEAYLNLKLYMIDHTVSSYSGIKGIDQEWKANRTLVTGKRVKQSNIFRVPTSVDWKSPAVDFQNGTSCLEALKQLGVFCGCTFVIEPDGKGVFYEIDVKNGIPYYVLKQQESSMVKFSLSEIISFSMSPYYDNNFNSIATFGFLKITNKNGKEIDKNDLRPGSFYTSISKKHAIFPWSKPTIGVETGFFTLNELKKLHNNRVTAATTEIFKGTLTVVGNTRVNHMYQCIMVGEYKFFVNSIEHSIDASAKMWTTTYGLMWLDKLEE